MIALLVVILDGLAVFALQIYGYALDRQIIDTQLELLGNLDQPVKVEFTRYQSPRTWLIKRGIDYEIVEDVDAPCIALHKTDVRIAVPMLFFDEPVAIAGKASTVVSVLDELEHKVDHARDLHLNHALYQR